MIKPKELRKKNQYAQACDSFKAHDCDIPKAVFIDFEITKAKDIDKLIKWLSKAKKWMVEK